MEKIVRDLFNQDILDKSVKKWVSNITNLKILGEVENFVYECNNNFIIRITHSSHRNQELIQSELDWINYLLENNINVCKPILSKNNLFIEIIELKDSYFIICAFEKAKGKEPYINSITEMNNETIKNLGKLTGKLHSLSKKYNHKNLYKRQEWFQEDIALNYERYLPKTKYKIIEEINELKNIFMSYEKTKESYGLIHSDIHAGNFFVNNNDIFLYDFDDSCYHWYIYDIATIIYSYVSGLKDNEDKIFYGKNFVHNFLESYFSINNLDKKWLNILSELIRFRDLLIYDFLYKKWDINNLNERQKKHFDKLDLRINKKIPLIDIEKILY